MKNRALLLFAGAVALTLLVFVATRGGEKSDHAHDSDVHGSTASTPNTPRAKDTTKRAEAMAALHGRVLAADGTGLGGATVALVARSEDATPLNAHDAVIRTEADGTYAYAGLPAGNYALSANAPGFLPEQKTVTLDPGQSRNEFNVQLQPGGFLVTGTVHDATGGTIPGAVVQALPMATNHSESSGALSGAEGQYQVGLANGRYLVWAFHQDYVPHSQLVEVSGGPLTVDFRLAPGAIVEGVVKHLGTNEPQAGAVVSYATERVNAFRLWAGTSGAGVTTTDAQGRFRIAGLRSGSLRLTARGDNMTTREPTRIALGIAEQRGDVELFLDTAFRVSGKVVDAHTGEGIDSMRVSLESSGTDGPANAAISDASGAFEIPSVSAGDYRVRAQGDRYLADMFGTAVVVESDTDVGLVKVTRGAMITGRVEPAGEAEISVDLLSVDGMHPGALAQVQSKDDGTFEIGPFAPSKFRLQASAGDGRIGSTDVDVPPEGLGDVVLSLRPGGSVEGTVVDAEGAPVADAQVSLRQDTGNRSLRVMVNGQDRMAHSGRTSPDGSFLVTGLATGEYQLRVLDSQSQPLAWADVAKGAARTAPKPLALNGAESKTGQVLRVEARNATIRGRVVGPDGRPAADTWVSASLAVPSELEVVMPPPKQGPRPIEPGGNDEGPTEHRSEMSMVMVSSDDDGGAPGLDLSRSGELPPVLTDADGRFEITGLRDGEYDLIAEGMRGAARAIVKAVATGEDIEIRMAALTRIEGTVTLAGVPVPRFTVEVEGAGHIRKQVRDDEGHFVLHRLDPGDYTVTARGADGEASAPVTVVPGKTATVAIALEELVTVTGTIVDDQGQPVAGLLTIPTPRSDHGNIQLTLGDDVTRTGPDGRFEVGVKPGSYLMMVLKMGAGPMATVPFEAATGAALDLGTIVARPVDEGMATEEEDIEEEDID